jgi:hypothetical protein
MTMSTHTPGSWTVGDYQEGAGSLPVNGPAGWGRVAYVAPAPADTRAEQREAEYANARLIAAAPDLLAALRAVAALRICWPAHVEQLVCAAIEKAEGK